MTDAAKIYRIHKRGRGWYRPNAQGYTANKAEAGLYTLEEARSYTHPNGLDGPLDGLRYELYQTPDDRPTDTIYAWPTYSWLAGSWSVTRFPDEAEKFVRATPEVLRSQPEVQALIADAVERAANEAIQGYANSDDRYAKGVQAGIARMKKAAIRNREGA